MAELNRARADFAGKFEELIESYDTGSRNNEGLSEKLLKLCLSQQRLNDLGTGIRVVTGYVI